MRRSFCINALQRCYREIHSPHPSEKINWIIGELPQNGPVLTSSCVEEDPKRQHLWGTLHFIHEKYEALGHMVRAPPSEALHSSLIFYLPHHGVLKPESTSTKLRVVFNGSCQPSSRLSINDLMHTGPNLLLDIFDVLIRMRQQRHLFATDITKMYRQIQVHPDDWNLQRILWIDDNHQETSFQLTTVTYGARAAPYLAVRALIQLVQDEGHRFPLAAPLIANYRYVDDIFAGADTVEELTNTAQQLIQLCSEEKFPLAKWHSTSTSFLNLINSPTNNPSITFLENSLWTWNAETSGALRKRVYDEKNASPWAWIEIFPSIQLC